MRSGPGRSGRHSGAEAGKAEEGQRRQRGGWGPEDDTDFERSPLKWPGCIRALAIKVRRVGGYREQELWSCVRGSVEKGRGQRGSRESSAGLGAPLRLRDQHVCGGCRIGGVPGAGETDRVQSPRQGS